MAPTTNTSTKADSCVRIRFTASECGQIAKQVSFVPIETGVLRELGGGDGIRAICLFARVMQQLCLWTQRNQAKVDCCCVWRFEETRPVHFAWPRTQASEPALTDRIIVWPRTETCRCASRDIFLEQASEPSTMTAVLLAAYSHMIGGHERRALDALLLSVSRSEPVLPDNCRLYAERRGDCVCLSWLYS